MIRTLSGALTFIVLWFFFKNLARFCLFLLAKKGFLIKILVLILLRFFFHRRRLYD